MSDVSPDEMQPNLDEPDGFPSRLKQAMGTKSIRGFARECGFSDTVLRQYLSGQSEPTRPVLLAIARAADVSLEWLAAGQAATDVLAKKYIYKETFAFEAGWLQSEFPNSFENLLLTQVKDESMEPMLHIGDLVLVDTNVRDLDAIAHGVYLLKLGDRLLIKRLQYWVDNSLQVLSDNPSYENFSIELSDRLNSLSIMGKVVWVGHKF
ncbi:XRE family transcriptional regulator [Leptothoe sp. PORK10 BA2]|uniref:XRE family transcriptional regulator n=1 Tax=Leptothoe sp. PORK10 BA2 TaxID=3110254 RepID=UPI002B202934|nr:LexA family transcriptional regulator [Leptothoe sp. PORK10 BA2]MEA5466784.1 LexA family transcriptional regulator [Leptothoe sp. PORK10 BA2]